jgi:tetrahydrodipicolinate N-succinyltransferase
VSTSTVLGALALHGIRHRLPMLAAVLANPPLCYTGRISYGRVPAGSVVVPGSLPSTDGTHRLYCAIIVKRVDAQTRAKTGINELLREATDRD